MLQKNNWAEASGAGLDRAGLGWDGAGCLPGGAQQQQQFSPVNHCLLGAAQGVVTVTDTHFTGFGCHSTQGQGGFCLFAA